MTSVRYNWLLVWLLVGIILGGLLGYFAPSVMLSLSVVGQLFLRGLRLLILPLAVSAIISGLLALRRIGQLRQLLARSLLYFLFTSLGAAAVGLGVAAILRPGDGVPLWNAAVPKEVLELKPTGLEDALTSLVPSSLPGAVIAEQFLGIIIVSFLFGIVLVSLGPRARVVGDFVRGFQEIVLKLVYVVLYAAPIGLLSVVGTAVAQNSASWPSFAGSLLRYGAATLIGLLVFGGVVLPLILKFLASRSILGYFKNVSPALSTALATGSASVAFPLTYVGVADKGQVDSRAAAVVLPLGMTMNLNGTALQLGIAALFVVQAFAIKLTAVQFLVMILAAVPAAASAALVPFGGTLSLVFIFRALAMPPEAYAGIGLLLVAEWILGRFRTVVDVWGDAVGAAVVAQVFRRPPSPEQRVPDRAPAPETAADRTRPMARRGREEGARRRPKRPARTGDSMRSDQRTARFPRDRQGRRAADRRPDSRRQGPGRPRSGSGGPPPSAPPRQDEMKASDQVPASTPRQQAGDARAEAASAAESGRQETVGPLPPPGPPASSQPQETVPASTGEVTEPKPGGQGSGVAGDPRDTAALGRGETPAPNGGSDDASAVYGRAKVRRGRVVKNGSESSTEESSEAEPSAKSDDQSADEITYGRSKKKRVR